MAFSSSTMAPPPGPPGPPNGAPSPDTSSIEASIIAAWVILTVFASFTVGLRFYVRTAVIRAIGVDDWLILAALIAAIGTCIGFIRQTLYGLLPQPIYGACSRSLWAMEQWYSFLFYGTTLALTKIAILFLYRRFLTHGAMRIANWVVLAIVKICSIWQVLISLIQCVPLEAVWNRNVQGWCMGPERITSNTIIHVITDFMIFVLPLPVLWKLNIYWKEKGALIGVFSLGFFVCLISIIRLVSVGRDVSGPNFASRAYWAAVEVNFAIVCACLTTLKPLMARVFPRLVQSLRDSKTDASNPTVPFSRLREPQSAHMQASHGREESISLEEVSLYPPKGGAGY